MPTVVFGSIWLIVLLGALVLVLGAAITGWDRYRRRGGPSSPHLQPTTEVFIDPESGRKQRVWYDPTTGVREYRDDSSLS